MRLSIVSPRMYTKASAAKTILQLLTPTNQKVVLEQWSLSFEGVVTTDPPALVELMYQTTAGTPGGDGGALTPKKWNGLDTETIQSSAQNGPTTAATAWTGEPTAGDILQRVLVHPQSRHLQIYPFGREIMIPGGKRLALRVTMPSATEQICVAEFVFDE